MNTHEKKKIDSIWVRMCRKMLKGGFRRVQNQDGEDTFKFFYKNEDVIRICKTKTAAVFCEGQHLRFLGHIARMDNNAPQKQWLFAKNHRGHTDQWIALAKDWNVTPEQIRRTIANKQSLEELLQATS